MDGDDDDDDDGNKSLVGRVVIEGAIRTRAGPRARVSR